MAEVIAFPVASSSRTRREDRGDASTVVSLEDMRARVRRRQHFERMAVMGAFALFALYVRLQRGKE